MSGPAEEIEFRNREQELDHLLARVPPIADRSTITFLRAPSGYGKTRLVDQVVGQIDHSKLRYVLVEPEIRARHQTGRVYAWYFVQRGAAGLLDQNGVSASLSFSRFLRRQRFRRIHWRSIYESGKEAFSLSKLVKMGIEFGENLLGKNRFHPDALLKDESTFATGLARDYLEWLVRTGSPILFVVRETQLIDLESFRFFLNLHKVAQQVFFYFEYTSESAFLPEHQKIVEESRSADSNIRIVDLLRLNQKEFLYLLKKYVSEEIEADSSEFLRWNGNLRLVRELKEHVYVDRPYEGAIHSAPLASDLRVLIHDRIQTLTNPTKLILASVVSHVEAIPIAVLKVVVGNVDTSVEERTFERIVTELVSGSRYLRSDGSRLAIGDEDVASVILDSPSFSRFRALAEKSLREVYLGVLAGDRSVSVPLPLAFRQAIALCLATGDSTALRRLIATLASGARTSHDQSMYVGLVADALLRRVGVGIASTELQEWASASAYEIGDYHLASELIRALPLRGPLYEGLLGFCYGETNQHAQALEIGRTLQMSQDDPDIRTLGRLIQVANLFAVGRKGEASEMHADMRGDKSISDSPLFGYVLRFTELFLSFPECTQDVLSSIDHFNRHQLKASAAYSCLSGAMHLAYAGDLKQASESIRSAKGYLEPEVRDLHVLYNNEAVVELLSERPDFSACMTKLDHAAYSVRDDFYRAVIENNRLVCRWQLGDNNDARLSVQLLVQAMRSPEFGNRDVFWTFTYNCWAFLNEIGDTQAADELRRSLANVKVEQLDYDDYWRFRFGEGERPPVRYDHLLKFRYHPEYLSHWLVDLDAIRAAKAEPR
jgi:hypothetical protein